MTREIIKKYFLPPEVGIPIKEVFPITKLCRGKPIDNIIRKAIKKINLWEEISAKHITLDEFIEFYKHFSNKPIDENEEKEIEISRIIFFDFGMNQNKLVEEVVNQFYSGSEKYILFDRSEVKFIVKSGTGHRVIIVMRGKGLSDKISNSDVHYLPGEKIVEDWYNHKVNKIEPLDKSKEAKFTAKVLQKFFLAFEDRCEYRFFS